MAMLDGLLSQISQHVDVADLAQKVGIPQDAAAAAIGALAQAHTDPGDTVEVAQGTTGLSPDILNQIIGHIGGEGSLGRFATLLQEKGGILAALDKDGDGNPLDDVGNMISGLFGKKEG